MMRTAILYTPFWLLVTVYATSHVMTVTGNECPSIRIKRGTGILNCTGKGMTELPEEIPDKAEVLDFGRNLFNTFPAIKESGDCHDDGGCPAINDTRNHCRFAVSFSRNNISEIHPHALHNLRCLNTLDLSYNKITSSALDLFTFQEGAQRLEYLILRGNPLGSLPDNVITQPFCPFLRHLDLSYCQLEIMGENSVDDFDKLMTLDLSNNKLRELKSFMFKGLYNLRFLDLRNNQLAVLGHQVFADVSRLDYLLLANNHIAHFPRQAFFNDTKLKKIDLSFNNLTNVPYTALQDATELSHLILSYNPIKEVQGEGPCVMLKSISKLEMEGMQAITRLVPGALRCFPSLVTLTVRYNKHLKDIQPKFLPSDSSNLREVYLEQNGLSTLSEHALPWKQLKTIRLQGNPWFCDHRIQWMVTADSIPVNTVKCDSPAQYKDRDIKTINPVLLPREFSLSPVLGVVVFAISLPTVIIAVYMLCRKRHHFPCCRGDLQGRYVTVFTRETDSQDEDQVDIEVAANHRRLKTVSNGSADDTQPFLTLEHMPHKDEEEEEEEEEEKDV